MKFSGFNAQYKFRNLIFHIGFDDINRWSDAT